MKTLIRKSSNATTGYELVEIDGEYENVRPIERTYKNEPFTLVLPQNAANRQYFNSKKVDAAGGEVELTEKTAKATGPRTTTTNTKRLVDYATDEERAIYEELLKTWQDRKEKDKKKPMTKADKLRKKIEAMKQEIAELEANEGNE